MGGGESKQIEVEEIRKSSLSKSPRLKNSKPSKSPEKSPEKSPPQKKKPAESATSDIFANKTTESTVIENTRHSEDTGELTETRSKKKIKSVRKLPPALENQRQLKQPIEEVDELNNSSGRYDRKAKNDNHQMQKLIRIYDLG